MSPLILAALMALPLYPLNPTEQDTINHMNLHFTVGFNGPSSVVSGGPEITTKWEWLISHPFILRTALDYRYGSIKTATFPDGTMHRGLLSAEVIYYRGTNRLTGYLGAGMVYSMNQFSISDAAADSLRENFEITDVSVNDVLGFRITAGLRILKSYSLEVGITEIRPKYVYTRQYTSERYSISSEQFRFNDFRVSVGYLFTLKI